MLVEVPGSVSKELIDVDQISNVFIHNHPTDVTWFGLKAILNSGKETVFWFKSVGQRDNAMTYLHSQKKKGRHMFTGITEDLKTYLKENRDLVFTVLLVLLVDQFAFEGAFRERVKKLIEGLLSKVEAKSTLPIVDVKAEKG